MRTVGLSILFFCAVLAGCSRSVNRPDLPGNYAVTIGQERQVIRVAADGTYENTYYRMDKLMWRYSSTWSYDGAAVTFEHFRFGVAEYDRSSGFWPVKPERTLGGRVEFCFDPDLNNRCFVRE